MEDSTEFNNIGVGIAIINMGKILLTKRRDFPVWCLPGGHLMRHESILDAAIREAEEETGLKVETSSIVGVYAMPNKGPDGSCDIILRGKPFGGVLFTETDETVDANYFSIDDLPKDLIGWQYLEIVDALSDRRGVLSILDARISIAQIRNEIKHMQKNKPMSSYKWFQEICSRPDRIDLSLNE
jgi:8-oxo-dGTP pyrophosphatase MutT (NUDIX family)